MSELPDGIEPAPESEPKPSALGIVLRWRSGAPEVLLGRRSRRARFMPDHLVFPGGKLDPEDDPGRAGAFARCASRELLEEAGLEIAPSDWHEAGERTTPPLYPVRFRTLFFLATVPEGAAAPTDPPQPHEIDGLEFATPGHVLAEWTAGRVLVPPPVLPILRALEAPVSRETSALAMHLETINAQEDAAPRIEFVPGAWVLPVRSRTLPPASCTNVWMPGGRRFLIVDPGSADAGENRKLLAVVTRRVALGEMPHGVLLTHHHRDHVAGASAVATALSIPVIAHPETLQRIEPLDGVIPVRAVADGDELDLSGLILRVVHTPGHAPGHLALFEPARRLLFAGDLVSGLSTILIGLKDGEMDAYLASLARAAALDPLRVFPSHGPPLPGSALAAAIAHRGQREAAIVSALSGGPRPLAAIAEAAYADAPDAPAFLRELQTRAHLVRLIRRGAVRELDGDYFIPGTMMES